MDVIKSGGDGRKKSVNPALFSESNYQTFSRTTGTRTKSISPSGISSSRGNIGTGNIGTGQMFFGRRLVILFQR